MSSLFIMFCIVLLVLQYITVFISFDEDLLKSKKEFYMILIPFVLYVIIFNDIIKDFNLKEKLKSIKTKWKNIPNK